MTQNVMKTQNAESPACQCGHQTETPVHFLLHCHLYNLTRPAMVHRVTELLTPQLNFQHIVRSNPKNAVNILVRGYSQASDHVNKSIFSTVGSFLMASGRFAYHGVTI